MDNILNKQMSTRDLYYYRRRLQNNVYHDILDRFYELAKTEGLNKKKLAELVSKDGSQVSNWLKRPSNLTLDTISDLLLAMGAELDTGVIPIEETEPEHAITMPLSNVVDLKTYAPPEESTKRYYDHAAT